MGLHYWIMSLHSQPKTKLGFFNEKLTEFFRDLSETFPEEKDLKTALEYIEFAKRSNPKLILDMFFEHVYLECHELIEKDDVDSVIVYARKKILNQYNEILPALSIFDKYWDSLDQGNQETIWKYLKVLCILCEKART
jgi:hypothetical protein